MAHFPAAIEISCCSQHGLVPSGGFLCSHPGCCANYLLRIPQRERHRSRDEQRALAHSAKGADRVAAGDTVIARAGTYAGFVVGWDFTASGTAAAPITFHAEPGVVINARNGRPRTALTLRANATTSSSKVLPSTMPQAPSPAPASAWWVPTM